MEAGLCQRKWNPVSISLFTLPISIYWDLETYYLCKSVLKNEYVDAIFKKMMEIFESFHPCRIQSFWYLGCSWFRKMRRVLTLCTTIRRHSLASRGYLMQWSWDPARTENLRKSSPVLPPPLSPWYFPKSLWMSQGRKMVTVCWTKAVQTTFTEVNWIISPFQMLIRIAPGVGTSSCISQCKRSIAAGNMLNCLKARGLFRIKNWRRKVIVCTETTLAIEKRGEIAQI